MTITNSGTVRPISEDAFRFQPWYRGENIAKAVPSTTKGTDTMLGLLLDQYQSSPILIQYYSAFFEEMDLLFKTLDEVYLGRFIDYAVGVQLDIIGRIINQSREINMPLIYFGFQGAPDADQMADEAEPSDGGVFRDQWEDGFQVVPLGDDRYRRLLKAKASVHCQHACSVDNIYHCTSILLGKTPRKMKLEFIATREMEMIISREDTTAADAAMVLYFAKYFSPLGTSLIVTREVL